MGFLLDFLHYLYYMVCALFSHVYHVTSYDVTLSHALSCVVSPREKEKKRKKYK